MNDVILFDMDGTLTEPRKEIEQGMITSIASLLDITVVGIVTGSPTEYIYQQCSRLFEHCSSKQLENLVLMPCNGLQKLEYIEKSWVLTHEMNMRNHITLDTYKKLVFILANLQTNFIQKANLPFTGNFISYRKSLVNWCMIGRDASEEDRSTFVKYDTGTLCRPELRKELQHQLRNVGIDDLTVTLGGSTSIDICPTGWDKSYALTHITCDKVWFVGDKCFGYGNDAPLYDAVKIIGSAHSTTSPDETQQIIENIILPAISDQSN